VTETTDASAIGRNSRLELRRNSAYYKGLSLFFHCHQVSPDNPPQLTQLVPRVDPAFPFVSRAAKQVGCVSGYVNSIENTLQIVLFNLTFSTFDKQFTNTSVLPYAFCVFRYAGLHESTDNLLLLLSAPGFEMKLCLSARKMKHARPTAMSRQSFRAATNGVYSEPEYRCTVSFLLPQPRFYPSPKLP